MGPRTWNRDPRRADTIPVSVPLAEGPPAGAARGGLTGRGGGAPNGGLGGGPAGEAG